MAKRALTVRRVADGLLAAGAGGLLAHLALRWSTRQRWAPHLERTNFRGRTVTLAAGPALAVGASVGAACGAGSGATAAAALVAGLGSGAVGLYDDIVGSRPEQRSAKGFAGHLGALRQGRVTSGLVKIVGVGAAGLAAASLLAADPARAHRPHRSDPTRRGLLPWRRQGGSLRADSARRARPRSAVRPIAGRVVDVLLGAGVIAGTANLVNLLDLRPGRAIKAGTLIGAPLLGGGSGGLAAGPLGAAAVVLAPDLDERVMLGDSGANALGALLGVALAARTGPVGRAGILAVLAALTAASERVSFTKVIQETPGLRELDALGRRHT